MGRSTKRLIQRVYRCESGFTLVEMMAVVGIIAVLAAVIIPNIGKFIGSGIQGAKDVEWESVQSGFELMVTDRAVVTVTPYDSSNSSIVRWGDPVSCLWRVIWRALHQFTTTVTTPTPGYRNNSTALPSAPFKENP